MKSFQKILQFSTRTAFDDPVDDVCASNLQTKPIFLSARQVFILLTKFPVPLVLQVYGSRSLSDSCARLCASAVSERRVKYVGRRVASIGECAWTASSIFVCDRGWSNGGAKFSLCCERRATCGSLQPFIWCGGQSARRGKLAHSIFRKDESTIDSRSCK